jgi:hypothetical protein
MHNKVDFTLNFYTQNLEKSDLDLEQPNIQRHSSVGKFLQIKSQNLTELCSIPTMTRHIPSA